MASNHAPSCLRHILPLVCAGMLLLGFALPVGAAEPSADSAAPLALTARAGVHPEFDRLVFDAVRAPVFEIHRDGSRVTIQFAQPMTINVRGVTAARLSRVRDVAVTEDVARPAVRFTVAPTAVLKNSASNTAVIFDVFGPPASPSDGATEPRVKEEPKVEVKTKSEAKPVAQESPAAATDKPVVVPPVPVPATAKAAPPAALPSVALPSMPPNDKNAVTKAAPPPAETASRVPPALGAAAKVLPDVGAAPELVVALDPGVPTGAVIFTRGGYGYVVFDRKLTLDKAALTANQPAPRVQLEPLDLPRNGGFRFAVPAGADISAMLSGNVWQIYLSRQRREITVTTELVAQPDFALGARLLLPVADAPEPVRFTDPVVGDDIMIVPLREAESFGVMRRFVDCDIVPSAQGLVVRPRHEKVVVRTVSDGVEVTAAGGLRLSSRDDTGASLQSDKKAKAAAVGKSLFDFALWTGKPKESFTMARQRLMQTAVDVPDAERARARLELARFYFAHAMGDEALSLLGLLLKQVPDLASHAEFLALRGAARILSGHAQDGLRDLSIPALRQQPEIELWQAAGAAQLRDWVSAEEKFNRSEGVLTGYPEPFYSRFSVLAIEAALATNRDHEAAEWLDRLEDGPHEESVDPALHYLRGVLHSKSGRAKMAQELWRRVAESSDHLYKIRAELALIDLGVATGSLTATQAADQLEGLRYAWRGDDLELDILHRLGNFYIESKNFKAGLGALAQAVRYYPDSPLTPSIRADMVKTFRDIYIGDAGKNVSPVEALTLFQQFRDLVPPGEDGKAVLRNLTERLVAIDLLEQAAGLLEDQVKNEPKSEEKAQIATRLAAIRLLDHNPDAAITALDASASDGLPDALQAERRLLRARALSEQRKEVEALELFKDDTSVPAKMLRADITMRAQRWSEAAKALSELIGDPPKPGITLSPQQAQWLVNDAIALSLAGDTAGLDRLAIDFGAAMAGTTQSDTFRVLTRPEKATQMRDIAAAQARIAEVDMFRGFLDTYRGAPPTDPKAANGKGK